MSPCNSSEHNKVVFEQEFVINNRLGMHARVAAQIVRVASQFQSQVSMMRDGHKVNGKSILDILTLCCPQGSKVVVSTEGSDAAEAIEAMAVLFKNKFGED